jgi:threonine dehydrogenase-like Zn-dependent dehydrogenase
MRALVVNGPVDVALRDVSAPECAEECLIRVRAAGICGTDLQLLDGYADFRGIPGHEFVGVVEHAGSPAQANWVGKRVAGEINVGCGACEWCRSGVKEHCPQRTVVGIRGRPGAFADFISLPAANLHEIPSTIDDRVAVFVEPLAAACRILEQVTVDAASRVAVLGDGRMGLLIAQVLRTADADVTVLGRHPRKLAVAREIGLVARPADTSNRHCFDIVVDATGRPAGLCSAMELVRPRGTIVLKSTFHGGTTGELWPLVVQEVTVVGSRCGPFARAIELLAKGDVKVAPLVSRVVALDDYPVALETARRELKVIFAING